MKNKTCRQCKGSFLPTRPLQSVCSPVCAIAQVSAKRTKARDGAHRARKRALLDNDRSFQLKEAQKVFNQYIRLRDKELPCVSCGRYHEGQWHAGHYRTTAAQPALRFNEINCAKQCMPCNSHKSGNITEYRINLIQRIGPKLVEWLEIDHKQPSKLTIDEIKGIRKYYQQAVKAMSAV